MNPFPVNLLLLCLGLLSGYLYGKAPGFSVIIGLIGLMLAVMCCEPAEEDDYDEEQ